MAKMPKDAFWDELWAMGPDAARKKLADEELSKDHASWLHEWLERQAPLEAASSAREANAFARKANDFARQANESSREANVLASRSKRIAITAIIISAILSIAAMIVSIIVIQCIYLKIPF